MPTDFLSPLLLSVDPFAMPAADGSRYTPNTVQLLNPNRTPMLIDEFRVTAGDPNDWSTMQLRLNYGSTPCTNQFIPIRSCMPYYLSAKDDVDCTAVWHLAQPLYVPPDVQVGVEFLRKVPTGFSTPNKTSAMWGFSIAGRSMPAGMEIPEKIYVPWACATSVYSSALPYISGDADIGNPFDEPLHVDYFTGMSCTTLDGNVQPYPFTIQMTLSSGKVLARDPIPFSALFPPDRPALRMRALLQPKEFVSVVMDIPTPFSADDATPNLIFTTVGMTGWREIQTPQGARP